MNRHSERDTAILAIIGKIDLFCSTWHLCPYKRKKAIIHRLVFEKEGLSSVMKALGFDW